MKERMMKMLALRNVSTEEDFDIMCKIESDICKTRESNIWQMHPGGLCYDRYLFGGGSMDVFEYGKLLYKGGTAAGYLLAYRKEREFVLRLQKEYEKYADQALVLADGCFDKGAPYTTTVNSKSHSLCDALLRNGFMKEEEERYQAVLPLYSWEPRDLPGDLERITLLTREDIPERVLHAAIPSGSDVTEDMFRTYLASQAYGNALEYVVRDRLTNAFIGFATWWVDDNSQTALLEPVGCLPEYRRRGIARRLLSVGLIKLKEMGMQYAFVSTSIDNERAVPLYVSLGFVKTGEANIYVKQK
jgi:ribosomal protein S18 acetylase RimI-like enzyme